MAGALVEGEPGPKRGAGSVKLELDQIRLALPPFELSLSASIDARVAAICGPSGAGKTTLLEVVAGLRRPDSGRVTLDGETLDADGIHRRAETRQLGYVPQDGALFPHLDVRANLLYGAPRAGRSAPELDAVIAVLELGGFLDRAVHGLSGGEQRRVALGRALLSKPKLLLLDEPLVNLDGELRQRLRDHLLRIRDVLHVPMLIVTHEAGDVHLLAEVILRLESGRLAAMGSPAALLEPDPGAVRFRSVS
ncbi:MAG: ATP-binding cassette domain-containing protein [Thermoanaerobaculia bacterium]